jgi:hypothetical protein
MFQTARDRKLRPGVGRNHPNQLIAAPRDKVAVPAVKFVHQTSVAGPLMLSNFFSEDTVVQTVYLLELFCSLRLFELDTGHLFCIRHKPPNVARRTQQRIKRFYPGLERDRHSRESAAEDLSQESVSRILNASTPAPAPHSESVPRSPVAQFLHPPSSESAAAPPSHCAPQSAAGSGTRPPCL